MSRPPTPGPYKDPREMTGGTGQAVSYWITLFGGSDTKADADVVKRFTKAMLPQLDVFLGLRKAIREVEQELGEATENRPPNFDTIKPHVTEHAPSWEELRGASDPDLTAFTVKPMTARGLQIASSSRSTTREPIFTPYLSEQYSDDEFLMLAYVFLKLINYSTSSGHFLSSNAADRSGYQALTNAEQGLSHRFGRNAILLRAYHILQKSPPLELRAEVEAPTLPQTPSRPKTTISTNPSLPKADATTANPRPRSQASTLIYMTACEEGQHDGHDATVGCEILPSDTLHTLKQKIARELTEKGRRAQAEQLRLAKIVGAINDQIVLDDKNFAQLARNSLRTFSEKIRALRLSFGLTLRPHAPQPKRKHGLLESVNQDEDRTGKSPRAVGPEISRPNAVATRTLETSGSFRSSMSTEPLTDSRLAEVSPKGGAVKGSFMEVSAGPARDDVAKGVAGRGLVAEESVVSRQGGEESEGGRSDEEVPRKRRQGTGMCVGKRKIMEVDEDEDEALGGLAPSKLPETIAQGRAMPPNHNRKK